VDTDSRVPDACSNRILMAVFVLIYIVRKVN